MDYELAKQLKDAGFSQSIQPTSRYTRPDGFVLRHETTAGNEEFARWANVRTPEELIEACGDEIEALIQHQSQVQNSWSATGFYRRVRGEGPTLEEAVARLWLALHEKLYHQDSLRASAHGGTIPR